MFTVKAQTLESKYGLDSAQTVMKASLYSEMVKQKNYKGAINDWRYVYNNAPKYQKSTYKNGVKIMKGMYKATKDKKYIDTLMMVYDQRIKYFGNDRRYGTGYLLGSKGKDLLAYRKKDLTAVKEAYGYLKESIKIQGKKTSASVLDQTMLASKILVENGQIQGEEVVDNYLKFVDMANERIANSKKPKTKAGYEAAKGNIENNFFAAGVADCETLSSIFTPKFEANPTDMELLNKILKLLNRQECEASELYAKVAEKKYELEPNAEAAHNLAKMFMRKKDFKKTEDYLTQAISLEENAEAKADMYFKLATIHFSQHRLVKAKANALKAISLRSNWGQPYILIGKAYASYSKKYGKDAFEHQTVYWAAVDKFIKAKKVDPECAAEASGLIATYSKYFPNQEAAFFVGLHEGDKVTIGDWINESTTVRISK
jgi:hypothetical protein